MWYQFLEKLRTEPPPCRLMREGARPLLPAELELIASIMSVSRYINMTVLNGQGAVLNGVCGKLVYCHRQHLGLLCRNRDLGAALPKVLALDSAVHSKLLRENLADVDLARMGPA